MQCSHCNQEHSADTRYCPSTGKVIAPALTCPYCHTPHAPGREFCSHCGHNLKKDSPAPVMAQILAQPAAPLADLGGGKTLRSASAGSKTAKDLKAHLQGWGIAMIVWGVLSFVFPKYLDPLWGGIIIVLGIVNLLIVSRVMIVVDGLAMITVGILNIIGTIAVISNLGISPVWGAYGLMQIVWGIQEIFRIDLYSPYRQFSTFPVGVNGLVGRFAVIPLDHKHIAPPSISGRQHLDQVIERVMRVWIAEGQPIPAELMLSGYDNDPRELYEIPEVCAWANRAVAESPVLPYFLTGTSLNRFAAWLCGPVSKEEIASPAFSQRFSRAWEECSTAAAAAAPDYFNRMGMSKTTFSQINASVLSRQKEVTKTGEDGHTYSAVVRDRQEMRRFRKNLPWRAARNSPLIFLGGILIALVVMAGSCWLAYKFFYGTAKPALEVPALITVTPSGSFNLSGQVCWTRQLTNFFGNRSDVWDTLLSDQIRAQFTFDQFKLEVIEKNPLLESDGYIFYAEKTYVIPEICP